MNYKELCANSTVRRYSEVIGIKKEDVYIEGKPIKKIKDNWIILLAVFAIVVGFLLVNFRLQYFLLCLGLIAVFFLLFISGNKYKVTCNKNGLNIKQYFRATNVLYPKVKHVYVSRTKGGIINRGYILVITCEDNFSLLRDFEFPIKCVDIEDLNNFVNNFKVIEQMDASAVKKEKRRSLTRIVHNIFLVVSVIILAWLFVAKGIIKLP